MGETRGGASKTATPGGAVVDCTLRLIELDDAFAGLVGDPAASLLGQPVGAVFPDLEAPIREVLASGQALHPVPLRGRGEAPTQLRLSPLRTSRGSIAGVELTVEPGAQACAAPAGPSAHSGILRPGGDRGEAQCADLEERFREALQNSPILVYTTDRELRYTWIFTRHPTFNESRVLGRRDDDLLPAEEAVKLLRLKQRVLDQEHGEREEVQLVVDGGQVVYDMTVEPLRDRGGAVIGLTVAAIDTTARRQTEAALRESEARYSALAEAVPAILFTSQPDGTIDYISQNYYDFTGKARGSGEGYAWAELLHPDDRARTVAAWREAVGTGAPFLIEYRFRRHDGAYRWFRAHSRPLRDAGGAILKWFGVCLDIDDTKRAAAEREELLAREQVARAKAERAAGRIAQLQAVTAALSEALTPTQMAEVIISRSVAALGAASGALWLISADGQSLDALSGADIPAEEERLPLDAPVPICAVARTGRPLYFEDRAALAADYPDIGPVAEPPGRQSCAIVPLSIEGRTIGSLALNFATARSFGEEERVVLLAMASQAAQAIVRARLYDAAREAIEARDTFIAIASHDLRSPLTALLGQAHLLARRAHEGPPEQVARRAHMIVEQSQRLNRMIGALLDLSRIQSGQLTIEVAPLDLAELAARVVAEIRPTLSRHTLELAGATAGLWVEGDELRLEQVLYNLIGNAVKYSPAGGAVMVSVGRQGAQAYIAVADQGIGIPPEALPRLFERYFRARNAGTSGMGIGLYAAREILALHGGTITVASEEGAGSTFTLFLPEAGAG